MPTDPPTPPSERHIFSFVITASGWRFLTERPHFPPWRAATRIPNHCIVPSVDLGEHQKKKIFVVGKGQIVNLLATYTTTHFQKRKFSTPLFPVHAY